MEQFFYEWASVLFVSHKGTHAPMDTGLPMVSHYSADLQVAVMCQGRQQYANKGREATKPDCKQYRA